MKLGIEKTKHAMRWMKRLCEDFGEEKGRDILEKADDIFEKLCSGNGSDTRELKEHTEKVIYPVMALYKALCEYCDSQKARYVYRMSAYDYPDRKSVV